jgi:hypothetical protein
MSAVGALVLVACDDSDEHSACEAFVACGGDVVGVWQIADACVKKPAPGPATTALSPQPGLDECSPTSVSEHVTPQNATLELSSDGEYWASGELASRVAYTYSRPCLQDRFNPARPDVVCSASISQTGPDPMDCVSDRASCRCSMERSMNIASTGRYEIRGTRIAFDGQPDQAYCIDGAEAQLDHPTLGKLYLELGTLQPLSRRRYPDMDNPIAGTQSRSSSSLRRRLRSRHRPARDTRRTRRPVGTS